MPLDAPSFVPESPAEILAWTAEHFAHPALTCSFGGTGIILAHMIAVAKLPIPVYFLDTGLLFPETLEARDAFARQYGLEVRSISPTLSVEEQAEQFGAELWRRDPDKCCALRKVAPMTRLLADLDAWVTGLRRDQGASRAEVAVVEAHGLPDGRTITKVNPLAHWTRKEAWAYIRRHDLPYNPLLDRGYRSIGCVPCTVPVPAGGGERDGRWAGHGKTECGLHTFTQRQA